MVIYAKGVGAPENWLKVSLYVLAEGQELEMKIRVGVKVSGVVIENGKPVESAWARLTMADGRGIHRTQTDAQGRFSFLVDPTKKGPFVLWAHRFEGNKRFEAKIDDYKLGGDPVRIELKPAN